MDNPSADAAREPAVEPAVEVVAAADVNVGEPIADVDAHADAFDDGNSLSEVARGPDDRSDAGLDPLMGADADLNVDVDVMISIAAGRPHADTLNDGNGLFEAGSRGPDDKEKIGLDALFGTGANLHKVG